MTDIQIDAGTLEFSDAGMTATGLLVPFGEPCRSNLGSFTVDTGAFTIPTDLRGASLNIEHAREAVVGGFASAEERPAGIFGTFAFAETDEGRAAYEDAKSGKRKHLSAEVADVKIKDGKAVGGRLFAAALVERPAFPSATLLATAPDTTDTAAPADGASEPVAFEPVDGVIAVTATQIPESVTVTAEDVVTTFTPSTETETPLPTATAPEALQAAAVAKPINKREAFAIFDAVANGSADSTMLARLAPTLTNAGQTGMFALNDVKYTGSGSVQPDERRPQWVDEVWSGRTYVQKYVPLFSHADLTAKVVNGFRWTTKPGGGDWAGNKANIPSNAPATEAATATAAFYAGGHDHAIEHQIFGTPGYFESYFAAEAESYAAWADGKVIAAVLAAASTVEADNPSGLSIGAGFSALIDGAAEVIDNNALPTFALVAPALWKAMMKTPADSVLGYLDAALGLESGTLADSGFVLRPSSALSAGNVLVGAKEAATVYELPEIIRVTAPDTVKGGIDTNVIGAAATMVNKADALVLVTPYTP